MYKLTNCGTCGSDIFSTGGCCGNPQVLIFKCPCGQEYMDTLEKKNKVKLDKRGEK